MLDNLAQIMFLSLNNITYHQIVKKISILLKSEKVSSVTQLCPTLCDPMDWSTPGFPVHHQLPELAQPHVHWVSDAIQPLHPLSSPSPPVFNFPSIRIFSNESVPHIRWTKYWSFSFSISPSNEYSGLISVRIDWLGLPAVQESSLTPQFKSVNCVLFSL